MEREEIEQIMVDNDKSKYDSVIEHIFNLEKQIRDMKCCSNCKFDYLGSCVNTKNEGSNHIKNIDDCWTMKED